MKDLSIKINVHSRLNIEAMWRDISFLFVRELNTTVIYVITRVQNKKVLGYINLLFIKQLKSTVINTDMAM